jgi:type III secretory pathway component EscU
LSRKEQIKLLVLSFVIVGVPILGVLHGFQSTIREFEFPMYGEIVIGVLVDVLRFSILDFLVPRFTMRRQLQIKLH